MIISYKILFPVLIPLIGAICVAFKKDDNKAKDILTFITVFLTFISLFLIASAGFKSEVLTYNIITFYKGIALKLKVDWFGILISFIISLSFLIVITYHLTTTKFEKVSSKGGFLFCFLLIEFGVIGVILSGSLLTLYFFFGIISITSWPLSAFYNSEKGLKNSKRYVGFLILFFKGFFLPAIILVYINCNNLDFRMNNIQYGILDKGSDFLYIAIYVLSFIGVANASILPMNNWLTRTISKSITVNIILFIIIPVTSVFSIIRIFFSVLGYEIIVKSGIDKITITIVLISLLFSSVLSFYKDDLIKKFSYLFLSQFACILTGITIFSENAVIGSILQLFIFVLSSISIFILLDLREKLGRNSGSYYMSAFIINGLCFAGVPLFSGFLAKSYLLKATFENDQIVVTLFIMLAMLFSTISIIQVYANNSLKVKTDNEHKSKGLISVAYVSVLITFASVGFHRFIIEIVEKVVIP
ncbi:MAG: hypothetical protein GY714_22455 [Desulfobacterales bacterium]|nr:hypothetical protein [Desulfobacterales bacterium]